MTFTQVLAGLGNILYLSGGFRPRLVCVRACVCVCVLEGSPVSLKSSLPISLHGTQTGLGK